MAEVSFQNLESGKIINAPGNTSADREKVKIGYLPYTIFKDVKVKNKTLRFMRRKHIGEHHYDFTSGEDFFLNDTKSTNHKG